MKLLLDEYLPKRLKSDYHGHETYTVREMGWNSKKNGELLQLMIENNFDALITFDRNMQYQQNFKKYPVPVIILNASDNSYQTLTKLSNQIIELLTQKLSAGILEIKEIL